MNCLSINIRGIGGRGKSGCIKSLKADLGVSFIGLQESMSGNINSELIDIYWGGRGADFEFVNSAGNSGGIVSIWDPKIFVKDNNFLCVSGVLSDGLVRLNVLNVYAPQTNADKRNLWSQIAQLIRDTQGWWIVLGDFNAVRNKEERKNSSHRARLKSLDWKKWCTYPLDLM